MTHDELLDMLKNVMSECARVLVPGGIMALNVDDIHNFKGKSGKSDVAQIQLMGHFYQTVLKRHQIYLTDQIIWQKPFPWLSRSHVRYNENTIHTSYRILDNYEPIYIFRKKGERELPDEETRLNSKLNREQWNECVRGIWKIQTVHKMEKHPCEWPSELPKRLIQMYSFEKDTVLDPFLGSGTTVKVARELNREGIGYERLEQYKAAIMEKLGIVKDAEYVQPLLDFAKPALISKALEEVADQEAAAAAEIFRSAVETKETVAAG